MINLASIKIEDGLGNQLFKVFCLISYSIESDIQRALVAVILLAVFQTVYGARLQDQHILP